MLTEEQAAVAKGLLLRGEKQHDIAAFFAVNGGRIAEIAKSKTFASVKLVTRFESQPPPCFVFNAAAPLRGVNETAYAPKRGLHEDVLYFWDRVAREFVEVLHSYSFQDYQSLQFQLFQGGKLLNWTATREDLELFRRHKKNLSSILQLS